jgi:hypothetical protein
MFFTKKTQEKTDIPKPNLEAVKNGNLTNEDSEEERKRALRRQFYEHLAQGNALAEAEDNARKKWQGR